MPTLKPDHINPTDAEEADIQFQIAEDPEDSAHWEIALHLNPPPKLCRTSSRDSDA